MRVALDTNVLAYAEAVNDAARQRIAIDLIDALPQESGFVPVQALGELFHVLVRKARLSRTAARKAVLAWCDAYALIGTSPSIMLAAIDLGVERKLPIWDAVILTAAAEADCRLLLSEDMQEGFTWRGVTVVNPFAPKRHHLLEALLKPRSE